MDKLNFEKAGNPLASKELEFVSRFWEPECTQVDFSKSFYFGVEESPDIINLIGSDYDYYVEYRNGNLKRIDDFVAEIRNYITPKSRILDLGCGLGQVGYRLQKLGHDVTGIDNNLKNVSMGQNILAQLGSKMKLQLGDALRNEFNEHFFDVIVSCDVIEHIQDQELFLSNIYRMLSPGGIAFIGTDNELRVRLGVFARRLLSIFCLKNPFKWKHAWADMDGGHCALITPSRLYHQSKKAGFINCRIKFYEGIFPFGKAILSTKYIFIGEIK